MPIDAKLRIGQRLSDFPIGARLKEGREGGMKIRFLVAIATAGMIASARAQQFADDHLGAVHFPISCSGGQEKFDRAVALLHSCFYPETGKPLQAITKAERQFARA